MESVEIHGPTEVYLGDNITLECITGESFPGEHTLQCCQFAQPHPHGLIPQNVRISPASS